MSSLADYVSPTCSNHEKMISYILLFISLVGFDFMFCCVSVQGKYLREAYIPEKQKTQIQIPAPKVGGSQPPVTLAPGASNDTALRQEHLTRFMVLGRNSLLKTIQGSPFSRLWKPTSL